MTNDEVNARMVELGFTFQYGISTVRYRLRDGAMAVALPLEGVEGAFQLVVYEPVIKYKE